MACADLDRLKSGNILRTCFNQLWDKALEINEKSGISGISYNDMNAIVNILRTDGPDIMGYAALPPTIDAGLQMATAILDPNKERMKANVKKSVSLAGGAGGASLVWICLGQILNPAFWPPRPPFLPAASPAASWPLSASSAACP